MSERPSIDLADAQRLVDICVKPLIEAHAAQAKVLEQKIDNRFDWLKDEIDSIKTTNLDYGKRIVGLEGYKRQMARVSAAVGVIWASLLYLARFLVNNFLWKKG